MNKSTMTADLATVLFGLGSVAVAAVIVQVIRFARADCDLALYSKSLPPVCLRLRLEWPACFIANWALVAIGLAIPATFDSIPWHGTINFSSRGIAIFLWYCLPSLCLHPLDFIATS